MFIGHFAVGLAAKRAVPQVSLAVLILAALFADMLWTVLVLAGIETVEIAPGTTAFTPLRFVSYPWSHSLLLLVVWGVVAGAVYRGVFGGRRSFVAIASLVVSHWVLDWITHAPDMPLYPGGPQLGLVLWNSVPGTMVVESLMLAVGVWLYLQTTRPTDRVGRWALAGFIGTLAFIYVGDSLSDAAPPSVTAICAVAMLAGVLFPAWAWWADAHRQVRE